MDLKSLVGKTMFFLAIVVSIAIFSTVFGAENSLIGVVLVILALMLLRRDLSVRPVRNICGLSATLLCMAIAAHVSSMYPLAGLVVNGAVVFGLVHITVKDRLSPMHFPFLIGYAFMISVPVPSEDMPLRMLALVIGSVLVVGLNSMIKRIGAGRCRTDPLSDLCDSVGHCAEVVLSGGIPDRSVRDRSRDDLDACMRGLVREEHQSEGFVPRPMDIAIPLHALGEAVCDGHVSDPVSLEAIIDVTRSIHGCLAGGTDASEVSSRIKVLIDEGAVSDGVALSFQALRAGLDGRTSATGSVGRGDMLRLAVSDSIRVDSLSFTFGVRMAFLFSLWAFVWQYWGLENSIWLLYTTVALVQPYVDRAWVKSIMRVAGTLVGSVLFILIASLSGGDPGILTVALLALNYAYTVLDPERYDVMMVFITASALIVAAMASPTDDVLLERVVFILMGVLTATLANRVILPYRIRDENLDLGRRYIRINECRISAMGSGSDDTLLMLEADEVSRKLHMNNERSPDASMEAFVESQDRVSSGCDILSRAVSYVPDDELEVVRRTLLDKVSEGRDLLGRAMVG